MRYPKRHNSSRISERKIGPWVSRSIFTIIKAFAEDLDTE